MSDTPKLRSSIDRPDLRKISNPSPVHSKIQHSPSLPNIFFPSYSHTGLDAKGMSAIAQSFRCRPSAPPSPRMDSADDSVDKTVRPRHVKRRTERDQPHSLLTPPLTPSSSIRTTTSDSTSYDARQVLCSDDTHYDEEIFDLDEESTRVLLLGNVNRHLFAEDLKLAIVDIIHSAIAEKKVGEDVIKERAAHPFPPDEFLKGINERHLASKGIIPVVFFDVRMAKLAKELLTVTDCDRLSQCIDKVVDKNGHRLGLSGRFVTLEELTESMGYSTFLDSVDGQFTLVVQKDKVDVAFHENTTQALEKDLTAESSASANLREGINVRTIQNVLKSIGSVRSFKFIRQHEDKDGHISFFYTVEYHDSRVASIACKELSNQTVLGMKFSTLRKNSSPNPDQQSNSNTLLRTTPFSNTPSAGESFGDLNFGSAGSKSNIRQRFNFPPANGNLSKEREVQDIIYQNPNPVPGRESSSPQYFYNTQFVNTTSHPAYIPESFAGHPSSLTACYDGACWYCPSTRPVVNNQSYHPYVVPPTPSPVYYPSIAASPIPTVINSPMSPPPPFFPYEYMDPQIQAMPSVSPWVVDPAIPGVAPGPAAFMPLVAMHGLSPVPYYMQDEAYLPTPRQYHPATRRGHSSDVSLRQQHLSNVIERDIEPPVSPPPFAHISESTPEPERTESQFSRSLVSHESMSSTGANPVSGQTDKHQLNLAKIAEGGDTRTTVMIKNIPNKMSDVDLTSYIAKVCPRRIDFLYLRMDFKNKCNMGYAFVNFISVEDLLHFANERLGQKWNMFSSEKVLQMSYATYQGKEALIEKFKNSGIMDEREAWRPRIFYSSGKDQGLPEPFPAPTHIGRKERSSFNRRTLFPPGANSHTHQMGLLHNTPRRYMEDTRTLQHRSGMDRNSSHLREGRTTESGGPRHEDRVDKSATSKITPFRRGG
ncbi:Meiosis protein mei2 [Psilocybe cubensis]|uniref:Meiosis protein mei2 n=2 Tax=Psilocybe cubensis TaxID=181762 RepID=A0ACB8HCQ0_PSICU|nr:Meiosis protein mei2 [Psilocybe cubensis]KAH9485459.1 Meiosis protein mei2 [Psilocybe cubensis]